MKLAQAILRRLEAVKIARDDVIDGQALDDAAQGGRIICQRLEERACFAGIGHRTMGGVESEYVLGLHGILHRIGRFVLRELRGRLRNSIPYA